MTMTVKHKSFRHFLQFEFARRCKKNESYSLRAFAKFLNLDPSRLSKILKGQRPISKKLAIEIGPRLNLSLNEIIFYLEKEKGKTEKVDTDFKEISIDHFEIITDPLHYSILEALKFNDFNYTKTYLCKKLKKPMQEISDAVERLQRVKLLEILPTGEWIDCSEGFSTHVISDLITSSAHKRYQQLILEKAIDTLYSVDITQRDHSSMMMATNKKKVLAAKEMIKNFRRELCIFLEDTNEKDTIYQLGTALFPLS